MKEKERIPRLEAFKAYDNALLELKKQIEIVRQNGNLLAWLSEAQRIINHAREEANTDSYYSYDANKAYYDE